jgi:hypothetical protein
MQNSRNINRRIREVTEPLWLNRGGAPTGTFTNVSITSLTPTCSSHRPALAVEELFTTVLIVALESEYQMLKPILATVRKADEGFVASFNEANIHASGDSINEAALNLKYLITDVFDLLHDSALSTLGPEPKRQRSVLASYIIRIEDAQQRTRR